MPRRRGLRPRLLAAVVRSNATQRSLMNGRSLARLGMRMLIRIDATRIRDWDSFHAVFKEALGFPDFYGGNMDAWIDCMSSLDDPAAGMTAQHVVSGTVLTLQIDGIDDFATRCPEQYEALVECSAFVNWRRVERGEAAVVALSFYKNPSTAPTG